MTKLYYSKSNKGFYDSAIHKTLPSDAVEISKELHSQLLSGGEIDFDTTPLSNKPPVVYIPTYQDLRRQEYPIIQTQLDTIFHDGLDVWKAQIQKVKDKYPKPLL